jgi:hypothetical protein
MGKRVLSWAEKILTSKPSGRSSIVYECINGSLVSWARHTRIRYLEFKVEERGWSREKEGRVIRRISMKRTDGRGWLTGSKLCRV